MRKIVTTLIFSLLASFVMAQSTTVSGTIIDAENGEPLIGANVVEKGTSNGTITDIDGNYQLTVSSPDATLIFSYVGYQKIEVPVNGRTEIDIDLNLDLSALDEVVVVGYGTQREKDLTSSITTVKADEIQKTPTSQAMQTLQGRVPGVQIVSSGAPGSAPTVRVRGVGSLQGNTAPLYVVDGMFFDNIDFLNTAAIESISILKDASAAAIYGVRAANGVVIIQTKSGSYNQEPQITYDGYYGVQVPQNVIKMANSEQFVQYINQTGASADLSFIDNAFQRFGRSTINPNVPDVNTDWYNEVMKPSAPIQSHSLSVSGGSDRTRFSIGASYFDQQGLVEVARNQYQRVNFRSKIDFDATEWFTMGGNVNISNARQYNAEDAVWFRSYFAVPILPVFDEQNTDADPFKFSNAQVLGYRGSQNPYYNMHYYDNRNNIGKILGNFYVDLDLIENKLSFKTSYNYSFGSVNSRNVNLEFNDGVTQNLSSIRRRNSTNYNQILDNILTYQESFGQHNLTVQAGYSYRSETNEGFFAGASELDPSPTFENEELWYIDRATVKDGSVLGDFGSRELGQSLIARISYNFNNRYLVYGTFRRDGTNKFQETWGNFPTVGLGWVLSEENFFNVGFVDFFKFRGSWGRLGNDGVPSAVGAPTLDVVRTAIDGQAISGFDVQYTYDLLDKWETTEEINVGFTSTYLGDRLSIDADYYIRDTENAVVTIILPLIRANVRRNRGEIRNQGLEMAINWRDNISDNLSYTIGGNFATLKNEVTSLAGQQYLDAGQAEFRQRLIVGEPISSFFGYEVEGIFQTAEEINNSGLTSEFVTDNSLEPGDFRFKDQNDDGVIDDNDRIVLGNYLPNLTYGFNFGLSYRNIDLTANFQGQSGHKILNRKRGEIIFTTDTNLDAELATNLWNGPGTSNRYPSAAGLRKGYNQSMSDYYVEDGSYFRVQNVRLSYGLVDNDLLGVKLPDARITFTAERPVTIFDYNGFNPEVSNGIDRQVYPIPAVYTVGLNLTL